MNTDDHTLFVRSRHDRRDQQPETQHETKVERAMRVSLARAFPVRTSSMREALVDGSITKLTRP